MTKTNLEELFLKDKYQYFKNNKFNIGALILGYIYLLYRKIYSLGIILFIINILLIYSKLYLLVPIINILLALTFNKLYLIIINKKIENYKLELMDDKLVKKKCNQQNTDILTPIIISVISLLIIIIPYINFNESNSRIGSLSYKLDNSWQESKHNNQYYYNYTYIDDNNDCSLTLELINSGDSEEFLNNILLTYNSNDKIETTTINNHNYKILNIINDDYINYIYTTTYNNDLYILLYNIYKDNGTCSTYHKNIINSINLKN